MKQRREGRGSWKTKRKFPAAALRGFGEFHGYRIHTVAHAGGAGAVVEDMAKMRVAEAAGNCGADHAQADVRGFRDIFLCDGSPETGPAGAGFELGAGVEQCCVAADAAEDSFGVIVGIFVAVGA